MLIGVALTFMQDDVLTGNRVIGIYKMKTMEKTIVRNRVPVLKARSASRLNRTERAQMQDNRNNSFMHFYYPPVKLPEQPQGYLKCKSHDCL